MAQLSGGASVAIRMDQLDVSDLIEGDPIENDWITLSVETGGGNITTFRGIGFTYDDFHRLNGGSLFAINLSAGGATLLNITGLTTRVSQFMKLAREGNDSGALGFAFSDSDTMRGTPFGDHLNGYAGDDNLEGGGGADTLLGGAGNDHIYGQSSTGGDDGNDSISGQDGSDYLQGNAGNDTLDGGAGSDRMQGGQGNDLIIGAAGNDTANGNLGNDSISGGDGNDSLRGGQGDDSLSGGTGNDFLSGDIGVDTLNGGTGADRFIFSGRAAVFADAAPDLIMDFTDGSDRIDIGYRVSAVLTGSRQGSFTSAAASAQILFDGRDGNGEVVAITVGSDTYLFFASDGGAMVDSAVRLAGLNAAAISLADFA